MDLLTRDQFRQGVFERDNHACVICSCSASSVKLDAHHILERRLFEDGGYYLNNGATLCDDHDGKAGCHRKAEQTIISCEEIRKCAGIKDVVLPEGYDTQKKYSKWGDEIKESGFRDKGPLFDDSSVQKILREGRVLYLYY